MKATGRRGAVAGDRLLAVALAAAVVAWMLAVEGRQGIGRDEAQYMRAGERYWGWFADLPDAWRKGQLSQALSAAGIDRYWSDNAPDHPVIAKVLYGVSWRAFHRCDCTGPHRHLHPISVTEKHGTIPLFARESTAFRLPAMLFAGLLAALVFRLCRSLGAWRPAAGAAAVMAIAQPHYFFHAQIACFDAPITTMAVAVGFAYWKSLRSARWGLVCGVLFGIALGIKHNAWLMPIFLAAHYLWIRRGDFRARRLPPVPLAFLTMATVGPLVFYLHWPWLWHAPISRVKTYVQRHTRHEHYNFEYLGRNWNDPPRAPSAKLLRATFPFVSTGLTVPATTLALAAAGGVMLWRRRRAGDDARSPAPSPLPLPLPTGRATWLRPGADVDLSVGAFLGVQIFGPLAVLAVPAAPIFGGVKHYLTAMPYIAVAAGLGLQRFSEWAQRAVESAAPSRPRWARALPVALAATVSLPSLVETRRSHPDGLSHYNVVAGGFAGGASHGMNRQFWGYSVLPMLDFMIANAPSSQRIYWHDVLGDAINMYIRDGRLPARTGNTGIGETAIERSELGILIHERHMNMYEAVFWDSYGTTRPAFVRDREGVPLVTAYRRDGMTAPSDERR